MKKTFTKKYLQVLLIVGFISIFIFALDLNFYFLNDYLSGFTIAFGITLVIISFVAQKSKKFMKKVAIAEQDERARMLKEKQMSAGYSFHIFLSIILVVVFGAIEKTYLISVGIAGMLLIEGIFIQIMGYVYKNKY